MNELAMLLGVAAAGFGLARWLRLPSIPLLLVLGMALSFSGVVPAQPFASGADGGLIANGLELGLAFLVFSSGVELNPRRFGAQRKAVLWVGFMQFTIAGGLGFAAARALGFELLASVYLAFALSASSTLVVLQHLRRQRQMFEPFGRLVIGVLLLQDLLMVVLIVALGRSPDGAASVAAGLGATLALAGVAVGLQRWVLPRLAMRAQLDDESLLLAVLAVLFAFAGAAHQLGLPVIVGAFLAGLSLSGFPLNGIVRGLLHSMHDFFLAIFFTALGVLVHPPDMTTLVQALVLGALVIVITPPLVTAMAEWAGLTSRAAIESGLLLAQASEFSLVLALTGLHLGHLDQDTFTLVAMVTAGTMCLTPFVATDAVTHRLLAWHPLRRRLRTGNPPAGHVLILGFGSAGMWVVKPLRDAGHEVLVVDDDPAIVARLQQSGIACLRGDGSDEKILAQAGAAKARLIIVSMRRVSEAEKVLRTMRGVPVIARVFEEADAERIRQLGGTPVLNSQAAAETFMAWFGGRWPAAGQDSRTAATKKAGT